MSDDQDERPPISIRVRQRSRPAVATDNDDAEATPTEAYAIGYKRPPLHTRFTQGRSGNPKGRPRGSKNWSTVFAEAAGRRRTVGVGGKKVRMSGREAIAEQLTISAMKGDARARRDFLNEVRFERQKEANEPAGNVQSQETLSANDEALLEDLVRRMTGKRGGLEDEK